MFFFIVSWWSGLVSCLVLVGLSQNGSFIVALIVFAFEDKVLQMVFWTLAKFVFYNIGKVLNWFLGPWQQKFAIYYLGCSLFFR